MKIVLKMNVKRARLLCLALEAFARTGMLQFRMMFEQISGYMFPLDMVDTFQDMTENIIEHKCKMDPLRCKHDVHDAAWDAYQWLRRELAWMDAGKNWRTDPRDFQSQLEVYYDEPFRTLISDSEDFEITLE